jgi:hypothetical protein
MGLRVNLKCLQYLGSTGRLTNGTERIWLEAVWNNRRTIQKSARGATEDNNEDPTQDSRCSDGDPTPAPPEPSPGHYLSQQSSVAGPLGTHYHTFVRSETTIVFWKATSYLTTGGVWLLLSTTMLLFRICHEYFIYEITPHIHIYYMCIRVWVCGAITATSTRFGTKDPTWY